MVSLYCDSERKKAVPPEYKHFLKLAKQEHKQVITLMDSNSHSEALWQSKTTCPRGREWENFLTGKGDLVPLNNGDDFTFMSKRGQSIIDVTLATPLLADRVSQWGVVDSVANSDHLSIEMLLQLNKGWTNPPKVWDLRSNKFDKKGFTTMMEERSDKVIHNRFVTPQDLDAYGLSFVMDIELP